MKKRALQYLQAKISSVPHSGKKTSRKLQMFSLASIIAALMLLTAVMPAPAALANDGITVTIDGAGVRFDGQEPVLMDGRTLVPVRGVFEQIGFTVGWNQNTRQATLSNASHTVVITIGSNVFTANGVSHTLDVPAQLIAGRTMLPLRLPLESVGYTLSWDASSRTVVIRSGAGSQASRPALDPVSGGFIGYGNSRTSEIQFMVRSGFEHSFLPQTVQSRSSEITGFLRSGNTDGLTALLSSGWNSIASDIIMQDYRLTGQNRDSAYFSDAGNRDRAFGEYGVTQSGHIRSVSIETVAPGTTMALIGMSNTGWIMLSTYIAIVHSDSLGVQLFALEWNFGSSGSPAFMIWHVTASDRTQLDPVSNDRDAFVRAVRGLVG